MSIPMNYIHAVSGDVVLFRDKFYLLLLDRISIVIDNVKTPSYVATYIDPFKQPNKLLVEGVASTFRYRDDSEHSKFYVYKGDDISNETQSECGFIHQNSYVHIPIPQKDWSGNIIETFDSAVRYYFTIDSNGDLIPKLESDYTRS